MSETFEEGIKKHSETTLTISCGFNKYPVNFHHDEEWVKVEDAMALHRLHCKKLLDFINKNRPKFEKGMHCESWALNDVENFFEELEGLLKK